MPLACATFSFQLLLVSVPPSKPSSIKVLQLFPWRLSLLILVEVCSFWRLGLVPFSLLEHGQLFLTSLLRAHLISTS